MSTKSLIKVTLLVTTVLSAASFSKPPTAINADDTKQQCLGWSSEISEIAGALHEAVAQSGTNVSELLDNLEHATQQHCVIGHKADKLIAGHVGQDISRLAAEVERIVLSTEGSSSAERVLAAALLKLIRSQVQVVATTAQG